MPHNVKHHTLNSGVVADDPSYPIGPDEWDEGHDVTIDESLIDHGGLSGLADDDHSLYALVSHAFAVIGAIPARLTAARRLIAGSGISLTDGGAGGDLVIAATTAAQQGPPGLDGDDGPPGPPGLSGPPGVAGVQGLSVPGQDGDDGEQGWPGPIGLTGATGATGPAGADGTLGARGERGIPGDDGSDGDWGPPGMPGIAGAVGAAGATGSTGPPGVTLLGPPGVDGDDGDTGWPGPPGLVGPLGAQGFQGPPGLDGEDGDTGPQGLPGAPGPFIGTRCYNTASQNILNATGVALTWNTELYDTANLHSPGTNPTRLTAPVDGYYHVEGGYEMDANNVGQRSIWITRGSDAAIYSAFTMSTSASNHLHAMIAVAELFLAAGDYVEVICYQTSTATRTVGSALVTSQYKSFGSMSKIDVGGAMGVQGLPGLRGPPGLDGDDGIDGAPGTPGPRLHADLLGLGADDHTQYALLAGRAGGQVLYGATGSGQSLQLASTFHATKGNITFGAAAASVYDEVNDFLGLGKTVPLVKLHVVGNERLSGYLGVSFDAAAPSNVTAGDITGLRLHLGTDGAFTNTYSALEIQGQGLYISGSNALAASGAVVNILSTITGANDSTRGLQFSPTWTPSGNITNVYGILGTPTISPASGKAVTNATGLYFGMNLGASAGGNSVGTIYSIYIAAVGSSGIVPATASYGIHVSDISNTANPLAVSLRLTKPGFSTANYYIDFTVNNAAALGAYQGKLPVLVGGAAGFIPWYL